MFANFPFIVAALALAIWIYLIAGRGGFWLASRYDDLALPPSAMAQWPRVNVVIPARDEELDGLRTAALGPFARRCNVRPMSRRRIVLGINHVNTC